MARRINMYRLLRQIHLYAGLVCLVLLLWFFGTGYLLTKYQWFTQEESSPEVVEAPLAEVAWHNEAEWMQWARQTYQIPGKAEVLRKGREGQIRMEFLSPRQVHTIEIDTARQVLKMEKRQLNAYHSIEAYHRFNTYGREWGYNWYLLGMDLASLSLLIFVISGVYLWWKLLPNKSLGWILLGMGLGYTLLVAWELLR